MSAASQRGAPGQRQPSTKAPFGTVRSELKKSVQSRHIRQGDYLALIGSAKSEQGGRCLGLVAGINHECEDPFDFMHFIKQQTIVKLFGEGHPALTDERLGAYACRYIHSNFDNWSGPFADFDCREDLFRAAHPEMEAAAAEHGLSAELEREVFGA